MRAVGNGGDYGRLESVCVFCEQLLFHPRLQSFCRTMDAVLLGFLMFPEKLQICILMQNLPRFKLSLNCGLNRPYVVCAFCPFCALPKKTPDDQYNDFSCNFPSLAPVYLACLHSSPPAPGYLSPGPACFSPSVPTFLPLYLFPYQT